MLNKAEYSYMNRLLGNFALIHLENQSKKYELLLCIAPLPVMNSTYPKIEHFYRNKCSNYIHNGFDKMSFNGKIFASKQAGLVFFHSLIVCLELAVKTIFRLPPKVGLIFRRKVQANILFGFYINRSQRVIFQSNLINWKAKKNSRAVRVSNVPSRQKNFRRRKTQRIKTIHFEIHDERKKHDDKFVFRDSTTSAERCFLSNF